MADDCQRIPVPKSWATSLTSLLNGSFLINSSVEFWYLRISRSATVPGRYRLGFFTPPVAGTVSRLLPPVRLAKVCEPFFVCFVLVVVLGFLWFFELFWGLVSSFAASANTRSIKSNIFLFCPCYWRNISLHKALVWLTLLFVVHVSDIVNKQQCELDKRSKNRQILTVTWTTNNNVSWTKALWTDKFW